MSDQTLIRAIRKNRVSQNETNVPADLEPGNKVLHKMVDRMIKKLAEKKENKDA
jgi:hypothetical protein